MVQHEDTGPQHAEDIAELLDAPMRMYLMIFEKI